MKRTVFPSLCVLMISFLLAACGGGGGGSVAGGGIGGTGITSGTVTGFGSVFVNGIEFETDTSTSFDVDDDPEAVEGDLGIGMVVTVIGTVNNDGVTGTADSIEYDDEIEGPITAVPVEDLDMVTKTFDVFDITVVVGKISTIFVATDYDSLAMDDIVEVSGFFDEFGNLVATRLEKEGEVGVGFNRVEARGTVSGCGGDCITGFTLGSLDITYDVPVDLTEVPGGVIVNGDPVEVEGELTSPTTILASRVEIEDVGFGEDVARISIEGIVSDFNGLNDFKVSGQQVNASGLDVVFQPASLAGTIADGDRVEVGGPIVGFVLEAIEVEQRGGDVKISAVVDSISIAEGTVTMVVVDGQLPLAVVVNDQTQFEDETGVIGDGFGLSDISDVPGEEDFLNIEAFIDGDALVATQIERDAPENPEDQLPVELQGPADVPPTGNFGSWVSILGVIIDTGILTDFENANDEDIERATFFAEVNDGDLIAFKDVDNDGLAEEVEFED